MEFGKTIGKKIETDSTFLPFVPRYDTMEHKFSVVFNDIPLIGFADTFCTKTNKKLGEYKTGKAWDQKKVDEHGQLTMYALMHFITTKIPPEKLKIQLVWLPTQDNNDFTVSFVEPIEEAHKIFQTKRTVQDIIEFGTRINSIVEQMEKYVLSKDTKLDKVEDKLKDNNNNYDKRINKQSK